MSTATASEVAETSFNEIRHLFLHCERNTPGRIARILHLFDKCALAEYTAQMENVLRDSTAPSRARSSPDAPPPAKRTKSHHGSETEGSQVAAFREPTFATDTATHYASTSSSQIVYGAGLAVPTTESEPDDSVMDDMLQQFINMTPPSPPPALQEGAQTQADHPQTSVPMQGLRPGGLPSEFPPPTPQPQPQPRAQAQGRIPYSVNPVTSSVLHPDQQSDEFFVPPEEAQRDILQRGDRTHEDWTYWEGERLIKGLCSLAKRGMTPRAVQKGEVDANQYWQSISHDVFFDSRSAQALCLHLTKLKQCYTQCLAYRVFPPQPGDGALQNASYDRNANELVLLHHIGQRLKLARTRTEAVGSLTEQEYLKWTYDESNGLFALMHQLFSMAPSTICTPGTYRSPSASLSRLPSADAAAFAVPRTPAPVIPDEDNDSAKGGMRTPTSSIDPRSSAPPSHRGHSVPGSRQPSTRPTSLHPKSGIQLETGPPSLPPGYIPVLTEEEHVHIQGLAAHTERLRLRALGRDITIASEEQATKQLQEIYNLACSTVERNLEACRKEKQAQIAFFSSLPPSQLERLPDETRREVFAPPRVIHPEEYSELLAKELTRIIQQRKELILANQMSAIEAVDPNDSASTHD